MINVAMIKEYAEGIFINPSEFIGGGPKTGKKTPIFRRKIKAAVARPYPEVCAPLWISPDSLLQPKKSGIVINWPV